MKPSFLLMLLVPLLIAVPAFASDTMVTGEVDAGVRSVSGNGTNDDGSAKFNEYDTRKEGFIGRFSLFGTKSSNYVQAQGNESGLEATIGRFDNFNLTMYYSKFEHNLTNDALTPFEGFGSDTLTLAPGASSRVINPDPRTWLSLDYSIDREQIGAKGEVTLGQPFFLSFDVSQTQKNGKAPWGLNTSSGNPGSYFSEVPLPVDYKTNTAKLAVGYRSKTLTISLDGTLSDFENSNKYLHLESPSTAAYSVDPIYLPPDNHMKQIGGQMVLRDLPFASTLALRGSYAKLDSDADILGYQDFNGDVSYTTAAVVLNSRPLANLETELSYHYLDKSNESDQIDTGEGDNELFHYTKNQFALEAGYRLTAHNRIGAGYQFTKTDRPRDVRPDAEETKDNELFIEWKNDTLDFLTARLRYAYLNRDTDFPSTSATSVAADYERPFDAATKDQNTVSVMFDLTPTDGLDIGITYAYVNMNYNDSVLGRTDDVSHEVVVDSNVALPGQANLYLYVAYEHDKINLNQRRGNSAPYGTVQDNTNYNWSVKRKDDSWSYGAKLQMPLFTERLKLTAAWDYQKNEGSANFSTGTFPAAAPVDINNSYGDYTKQALNLKADYSLSESFGITLGYLYEKYELDDLQYNDYLYSYGTSAASTSYLTGAYADQNYEANVGYVALNYKF